MTTKFKAANTIVGLEIFTIENIMSFGQKRSELQNNCVVPEKAQRNCPTPGGAGHGTARTRTPAAMPSWHRTPPAEGESHERSQNGKDYKFCATCGRWFFGSRAHLTSEHTTGFRRQPSPVAPSINNASGNTNDDTHDDISESDPIPLSRTYFNASL